MVEPGITEEDFRPPVHLTLTQHQKESQVCKSVIGFRGGDRDMTDGQFHSLNVGSLI